MKPVFAIAGRAVGRGQPCYVIAEAGVNHNCDVQLGYKLIETAGAAGADAIKFQSYTASKIATRAAPRYWVEPADPKGTQWDTFDKLDKLSDRDFKSLLGHARQVGLTAFSTPFDDEAVDFLASLDVPAFKIASADLTCHGLIERAARVTVEDVEGQPGWYRCSLQVRPHFKYMGASFTLSLVGKLDKE